MVAVPLPAPCNLAWVPAPMPACNIGLSVAIMNRGRGKLERAEAPPLSPGLAVGTFIGAANLSLVDGRSAAGIVELPRRSKRSNPHRLAACAVGPKYDRIASRSVEVLL
jgi:hypothetical protein